MNIPITRLVLLYLLLNPSTSILTLSQDLNSGRIAQYEFNGNANDNINNVNGAVLGAVLTTDRFGNSNSAYEFDGVNDYIQIPYSSLTDFGSDDDFSISLWAYIPVSQNASSGILNEIMGKWNAVNSQGYPFAIRYINEYQTNGNDHKFITLRYDSDGCNGNPYLRSPCPIETDNWYHIVLVKSGSELYLYQNGELVGTENDNTSNSCGTENNEPILIGKRQANQRHFKGKVDDINIYDRNLSDQEVLLLYLENSYTPPIFSSSETDIINFTTPDQLGLTTINDVNSTIELTMPCDYDLTNITIEFQLSTGANAYVDGISQVSNVTSNDFSLPVTYEVIAENDCTIKEWTVNIQNEVLTTDEEKDIASIINFAFNEQTGPAVINNDDLTIDIEVDCSSDLSNLIADFQLSNGAEAYVQGNLQSSGNSINDFSNNVIYSIKSENGCVEIDWAITVSKGGLSLEDQKIQASILNFEFDEQTSPAIIDSENFTIDIEVPCAADITKLIADFELSNGAKAYVHDNLQFSGNVFNDFSDYVTYTVVSENECAQIDWKVFVSQEEFTIDEIEELSSIIYFRFDQQINPAIINSDDFTIDIEVSCSTDIKNLIADFELYNGAEAYVNGGLQLSKNTYNDFSNEVIYSIVNNKTCSQIDWTIRVTKKSEIENNDLLIPNVITPNGDGLNDTWQINLASSDENIAVDIINRWGKIIYSSAEYNNNFSGSNLPSGVYYYNVNIEKCDHRSNGWLHIIK